MCDIVWISISIRRRSLRRRRLRRLRQLARASLPSRLLRCDARTPPQPNPKPDVLPDLRVVLDELERDGVFLRVPPLRRAGGRRGGTRRRAGEGGATDARWRDATSSRHLVSRGGRIRRDRRERAHLDVEEPRLRGGQELHEDRSGFRRARHGDGGGRARAIERSRRGTRAPRVAV
eukprot:31345-Pelagococcus_subviridis.AAC.3